MRVPSILSLPVTLNLTLTLNLICLQMTLTFGRSVYSEEVKDNPTANDLDLGNTAVDVSTYRITKSDKEKIQQMATIVESLEKLGILDPSQKHCYTVDKIVKSLQKEDSNYRVGIYFYIKESNNNKENSNSQQDTSPTSKDSSSNSSSVLSSSSSSNSTEGCESLAGTSVKSGSSSSGSGSQVNSANSRTGGDTSNNNPPPHKRHKPKLSKTQIMVIATCSTVIGLFFIVAVIMRVRNYMKRNREDTEINARPTFRSCSVALRGGDGFQRSNNHYSTATKSNDAGPAYNKVVNETEKEAELEDDLNEPKSANENRPLLIVTSASAPPSPLPARKDFRQKSKDKNQCVKYIPKNNQSNYTNTAMEDEDMATVPMETPDDDVSCKTPGSQETLLDDVSDSECNGCQENNQPMEVEQNRLPDLFADCPRLIYEHTQRESSDDTDQPIVMQRETDVTPWENNFQTGVGFSQSDNSLSDRNQMAYCYSNQVEYYGVTHTAEIQVPRACSAPPTPEVVRKQFVDNCPHYFPISSECDVSMSLDDEDDDAVAKDVNVTPISASCQSPPVYTQAPSTFCQVTNSTNQRPQIVVQPPLSTCPMNFSSNQGQDRSMSFESDNYTPGFQGDHDPFPAECDDVTNMADDCFSDSLPANKTDTETDTQSNANPNSITNSNTLPNSPPEGGDHASHKSSPGGSAVQESEVQEDDSDASDSEDDDSLLVNLSYGERFFLLDPAFEGMEPTYV